MHQQIGWILNCDVRLFVHLTNQHEHCIGGCDAVVSIGDTDAPHSPPSRAGHTEPALVQQGSLEEGELFVITVSMRHGSKQMEAELLMDMGCDIDLVIADYRADQLGLPRSGWHAVQREVKHKQMGAVRRR